MAVNYNDERFKEVETEKKEALTELEQTYGGMVKESDKYYQAQIDASKKWETTQKANQQAQTDFAIEKIEQQKDQTTKDYTKEQSGAYVDWQKESNRYGANAEAMASQGLINTGYGESSQVRMYNTYQNRVATAREAYSLAIVNYNNAIKDAQLQNNSALAEIAYKALQQQLELSLQGFQYKNQLILEQANKKKELENTYYSRYQDVLAQINQENALAEQIRQYNQNHELQVKQFNEDVRRYNEQMAAQASSGGSGGSSGGSARISKASGAESAGAAAFRESVSGKYLSTPASQKLLSTKQAATQARATTAKNSKSYSSGSARTAEVKTDYYQGAKNSDANRYGTFSNGYQPKGISGYGAVSKTGDTVTFTTQTLSGKTKTVKQNVWKTVDGSKWYWDGRYNKYIKTN
jgi:hypothetical protein